MRKECDRVRDVVSSAIKRFFREEQHFKSKFSIDALIGVTLEGNDMFYVTLNEVIDSSPNYASSGKKQRGASHNRSKTKTTRKDGQCTTLLDMQCHSASSPRGPNLGEVLSQSQEAASSTSDIHRSDFDDDNSSEGSDRNVAIKQEIDDSWYDNSQSGNDDEDHEMATDNFSYGQFSNIPDDSGTTSGPNIPISNTLPSSEGQTRCQESSAIASTSQTVSDLPLDPDGNILASTSTSNPSLPHPEGYEGPMPYVVPSRKRQQRVTLGQKIEVIKNRHGTDKIPFDDKRSLSAETSCGRPNATISSSSIETHSDTALPSHGETQSDAKIPSSTPALASVKSEPVDNDVKNPDILLSSEQSHQGRLDTPRIRLPKRKFDCELCDKSFKSKTAYLTHKRKDHLVKFKYLCKHCGKRMSQKSKYDVHMASHGERPYQCTLCSATFARSSIFLEHKKVCGTTERPFTCAECGKAFNAARYLKDHFNCMHTNQQYTCAQCGATFKHRAGLAIHNKRHHVK